MLLSRHATAVLSKFLLVFLAGGFWELPAAAQEPVINLWYGEEQRFGHLGNPHPWVNVLGNVASNAGIASLTCTVNGGSPRVLSVGCDLFRLAEPGDFNIDIHIRDLQAGENLVRITAVDSLRRTTTRAARIHYTPGRTWPLPCRIDWSAVRNIQDAVQVVDGRWRLEDGGIRTVHPYYDRVLALGDLTWTDYEMTVQVTYHPYTPPAEPSKGPPYYNANHASLLLRWQGHHRDDRQPHVEWRPLGAIAMLTQRAGQSDRRWIMVLDRGVPRVAESDGRLIQTDVPYLYKMQVETLPGPQSRYRMKVWKAGTPEPDDWDLTGLQGSDEFQSGSALLVCHHADVTFGNISVVPLP